MPSSLKDLAKVGAAAKLEELHQEIRSLYRMFPTLKASKGSSAVANDTPVFKRGRRGWNKAQRDAAAKRMRAYWAKRKRKG